MPSGSAAQRALTWARARQDSQALLRAAHLRGDFAAASLQVTCRGQVVAAELLGQAQSHRLAAPRTGYLPQRLLPLPAAAPVTAAHLFDLASLTKVLGTQLAVQCLISDGRLALDDRVGPLLPWPTAVAAQAARSPITVRHLLAHRAGFCAWLPLYFDVRRPADLLAWLAPHFVAATPARQRCYSDLGYLLLGALVAARAGCALDAYYATRVAQRLGQLAPKTPHFLPSPGAGACVATGHANVYERRMIDEPDFGLALPASWPARPSTAFSGWRAHTLVGEVDDGNAHYAMAGVAGHAGLFGTASAVTEVVRALTGPAAAAGPRALALNEGLRQQFLRAQPTGDFLGWFAGQDLQLGGAEQTVLLMRGFTGCCVLAAPAADVQLVLLSNRQHAAVDGRYQNLAPLIRSLGRAWGLGAAPQG